MDSGHLPHTQILPQAAPYLPPAHSEKRYSVNSSGHSSRVRSRPLPRVSKVVGESSTGGVKRRSKPPGVLPGLQTSQGAELVRVRDAELLLQRERHPGNG